MTSALTDEIARRRTFAIISPPTPADHVDREIAAVRRDDPLRGFHPAQIVYKGYGIFQYDLQHVRTDEAFFRNRLWHQIDGCLDRLGRELDRCFAAAPRGNTHDAVRRYNGSGSAAETYADHVMAFADFCTGIA